MTTPAMRTNETAAVYSCPHGGTWSVTTLIKLALEKEGATTYYIIHKFSTATPITPCPSVPGSGIPPCVFSSTQNATGSNKVLSPDYDTVKSTDTQTALFGAVEVPLVPIATAVSKKVML